MAGIGTIYEGFIDMWRTNALSRTLILVGLSVVVSGCQTIGSSAPVPIESRFMDKFTHDGATRPWFHRGVDIPGTVGDKILAAADGTVTEALFHSPGSLYSCGNVVVIQHPEINGESRSTRYCHLNEFAVQEGQKVKRGDVIGTIGLTGWTNFPHLHFEVKLNGFSPIDPEKHVSACFDPDTSYPQDRIFLTWPIKCSSGNSR